MKKLCALAALLAATTVFAQDSANPKKNTSVNRPHSAKAPAAPQRLPTGPVGFGPIKLGMTQPELESLQADGGTYLQSPLTPYESKEPPKDGEIKLKSLVHTPLQAQPLEMIFTFTEGSLTNLYITLEEVAFDKVKAQVTEKYGAGKVEDTRKEERCLYRNGANFTVTSGQLLVQWYEPVSDAEKVEARLSDFSVGVCPSNLKHGLFSTRLMSLSLRKVPATSETKPANLF